MVSHTFAVRLGLSSVPAWLREDWVPDLRGVEAPVLSALGVEHRRLLAEVEAADAAHAAVDQREAPSDMSQRMIWRLDAGPGGMAANAAVREARQRVDRAVIALCEWIVELAEDHASARRELHGLMHTVARNDEERWPEVKRAGRFVTGLDHTHDLLRAVHRAYRAAGGVKQEGVGVAW